MHPTPDETRGHSVYRGLLTVLAVVLVSGLVTGQSARGGARGCAPMALVAHRGIAPTAAENTLAAFENARRLGYDAVETDVRISADDRFVLAHDPDLRRTAGRPDRVVGLRADELARVRTRGGYRIPNLRQALRWSRSHHVRMVLHLKYAAERQWTVGRLVRLQRLVTRSGTAEHVTYLSYSRRVLRALEALDESSRTGWLPGDRPTVEEARLVADQVFIKAQEAEPGYVRAMHRAGVQVNGTTTQTPQELAVLAQAGAVRTVTDDVRPGVARDLSRLTRRCVDLQVERR